MAKIDYAAFRSVLDELFSEALLDETELTREIESENQDALNAVFASQTQSYREVLLGCALMHLIDAAVNIRLPYINHGAGAYNGRTLDEKVINPFLQDNLIPCSKGPFLATFRRSVTLTEATREGLRDKAGYDAMLTLLSVIEKHDEADQSAIIICLLRQFIKLRDASRIPLMTVQRLSQEQLGSLLDKLCRCLSGGQIPVFLTVAYFQTLNDCYNLNWDISWQGINVADKATGVDGDITALLNGKPVFSVEVTERPIARERVNSTFNTKIVQNGAFPYLFVYTNTPPDAGAYAAARQLFMQGYDVNFAQLHSMIANGLSIHSAEARKMLLDNMIHLLDSPDISSTIKQSWNECLKSTIEIG